MKLANEIVDLLSSDCPILNDALFKAQVLAHRMGQKEMLRWVESELRGYPENADLPDYRRTTMTIVGNISNTAYRHSEQPLPLHHLDKEQRQRLESNDLRQSIAVIEQYSKNESDLALVIYPVFYGLLNKGLGNGFVVERAWGKASLGTMLQVTIEVRARLLQFVLELSDRIPDDTPTELIREASLKEGISDLFRNSVIGDNATILVGSGSIGSVANSVRKNDFDSLAAVLSDQGVGAEDLAHLGEAISEDGTPDGRESFGPRVRGWIGSMVAKAGTSAWRISMTAAGNILGVAIAAYYGISA